MGKYFGTDGFRGEAGVTLTADHAFRLGRILGAGLAVWRDGSLLYSGVPVFTATYLTCLPAAYLLSMNLPLWPIPTIPILIFLFVCYHYTRQDYYLQQTERFYHGPVSIV